MFRLLVLTKNLPSVIPTACIIFLSLTAFTQQVEDQVIRKYSPHQLIRDFRILEQNLLATHPALYTFISADSLSARGLQIVATLTDSLTEDEFHILVRHYVASIRCGHTMARPSEAWYTHQAAHQEPLPFEILLHRDKLFVKFYYHTDSLLAKGTEILTIDNRSAMEIIDDMKAIQERDGFTSSFVDTQIEKLFRTYYIFLYGSKSSYTITIADSIKPRAIVSVKGLKAKPASAVTKEDTVALAYLQKTTSASFSIRSPYPQLGYLDIDRFQSKGYKKFYKTVFGKIHSEKISHLVIDLRGNGGGYFPNGNYLLEYLLAEPVLFKFHRTHAKPKKSPYLKMPFWSKMTKSLFSLMPDKDRSDPNRNFMIRYKPQKRNGYKGVLYVLTDGGTFSMSSYVATKLQHHSDAILFGRETGGGEAGSNAILKYELLLPETGIRVNLPYYVINHDVQPVQFGRGVMPDIQIEYNLRERLDKWDKEMEKVYEACLPSRR